MHVPRLKPADPAAVNRRATRRPPRRVCGLYFALAVLLTLPLSAAAQRLQGDWVDASERRIDQARRVELRVIVLGGDGQPVANAPVHIQQVRHDFTLGMVRGDSPWPDDAAQRPVWRCFNAVSLDRLTAWPRVQPSAGAWDFSAVEAAIADARRHGLRVRWGGVLDNDIGLVPDWVAALHGDALRDAILAHVTRVTTTFHGRVEEFDACTELVGHAFVQRRLGVPMLRRLFEHAAAGAPRAAVRGRFDDALTPLGVQDAMRAVLDLRDQFVPISDVALAQRMGGIIAQAPLERAFDLLGDLGVSVIVAPLEIGGSSPSAAAVNTEIFLRTAFAEPSVEGIYFAGLSPDQLADPGAALLDPAGDPTEAGDVVDGLFRRLWWTDTQSPTDELGNVYARVFAGVHQVSATLPTGETLETMLHVAAGEGQRVVVLEPLRPRR